MEKVKRNRAPNWEQTEKNLFRELMKDEVTVIENKNTDTNTNKAKVNAWSNVLNRFNELNSRERSLNELKQPWRVLKGETKKCISTYQHELKKTGGGPKPPSPNQEILDIVDMIPNEFTTDENKFDSNYVVVPSDNTVDILESKEVEPCFSGNVDIKSNQVEPESSCFKVIQSETPSCTTSVDEKKSCKRKLPLSEENRNQAVQEIRETALRRSDINLKILEEDLKLKKIKHNLEIAHMQEEMQTKKETMQLKKEEMQIRKKKLNLDCEVLELQKQILLQQLSQ